MGYAWAPQITGLVRGEPKPGQKHRSNGKAILMECCEERASKSETLDRSRSSLNTYWHRDSGLVSGTASWEAMCADADAYKVPVKLKNGKTAERGLPHNAVIGWAMIVKPPLEMIVERGMTDKDIRQFCADGFKAMSEIEPRLFRMDNVEALATHRDEDGTHVHICGTSKDKNGRYCGNLVDASLCVRINERFPALMREMGWPIDDIDLTDWERMKTDEGYKLEREAKRKRQGQSVNRYAKSRAANAGRVAAKIITDAQDEAQAVRADADEYAKRVQDNVALNLQALQNVRQGVQEAQEERERIKADIEDLEKKRASLGGLYAQEKEAAIKKAETDAASSARVKMAKAAAEPGKSSEDFLREFLK